MLDWSDPVGLERRLRALPLTVTAEHRARLREVVASGGAMPRNCVHDLRHTYATLALRLGDDVARVARTLGHAKVSITHDTYRHVIESERRQNVVDLFDHKPTARPALAPAATA